MEDDVVLREAIGRRDSALSEARRLDDFIRMYNDLRGTRSPSAPLALAPEPAPSGKGASSAASSEALGGEFILDKQRR